MSLPGAITVSRMLWSHLYQVLEASPAWCAIKIWQKAPTLVLIDRRIHLQGDNGRNAYFQHSG
jgi:hypothetical protein